MSPKTVRNWARMPAEALKPSKVTPTIYNRRIIAVVLGRNLAYPVRFVNRSNTRLGRSWSFLQDVDKGRSAGFQPVSNLRYAELAGLCQWPWSFLRAASVRRIPGQ